MPQELRNRNVAVATRYRNNICLIKLDLELEGGLDLAYSAYPIGMLLAKRRQFPLPRFGSHNVSTWNVNSYFLIR